MTSESIGSYHTFFFSSLIAFIAFIWLRMAFIIQASFAYTSSTLSYTVSLSPSLYGLMPSMPFPVRLRNYMGKGYAEGTYI